MMPQLQAAGENALILYLGHEASPAVAAQVQAAASAIDAALGSDLVDLIPSYASVLIIYDVLRTDHYSVAARVRALLPGLAANAATDSTEIVLPVYYAPEAGADLEQLAANAGLDVDEVIALCDTRL